jgi:hypothetical protein
MKAPGLAALVSVALALAATPIAAGEGDHGQVCAAVLAMSPRLLGCEYATGPQGQTRLVLRVDRAGLAADYAAAYAAAEAAPDPTGERHHRAVLIETAPERGAVYALAHDSGRFLSAIYIDDGRGPRVIREETIEACRMTSRDQLVAAAGQESDAVFICLASVQPSVFTLVLSR